MTTKPNYRKPWTNGAHAYPEADNLAGVKASMYRRRKPYMLHVSNATKAIGNRPCDHCGKPLSAIAEGSLHPDMWSTWTIDPRTKRASAMHYACSWTALLTRVYSIRL
jgi:hypothetical protein